MGSPAGSPPNAFWEADMSEEAKDVFWSVPGSQLGSAGGGRKEKKRVGFTGDGSSSEMSPRTGSINPTDAETSPQLLDSSGYGTPVNSEDSTPRHARTESGDMPLPHNISRSHLPELSQQQTQEIHEAFGQSLEISKPRPAIRRNAASQPNLATEEIEGPDEDGQRAHRQARMREAFERGKRLEHDQRSEPNSRYNSPERAPKRKFGPSEDIPLKDLSGKDHDDEDWDDDEAMPSMAQVRRLGEDEANRLVRKHTMARAFDGSSTPGLRSGAVTPTEEQYSQDYRPQPEQYRGGILGALLKLYNSTHDDSGGPSRNSSTTNLLSRKRHSSADASAASTPAHSPPDSGTVTPNGGSPRRDWISRKLHKNRSTGSLARLVGTTAGLGSPVVSGLGEQVSQRLKEQDNGSGLGKKSHSSQALAALGRVTGHQRRKSDDEIRIKKHIAETIARQRYLMRLCRALMMYGAPTHRLEEYMRMSARVLEIDSQFLYIPGSMIMSFDDASTHTTEVKLVKTAQGIDLGKLRDVHDVYKEVVHDQIGVEEATQRLKSVMGRKAKHSRWLRIPVFGLAAVFVGPFAFQARLIDLPISFILGCILGILQLVVAPASDLYANVFEISAAVITSFLARAFGSIPHGNDRLFCFSALAQSSIALILPGYIVLCASLELQSKSIVAGSVRMVYAIIYSLFLGFGITIGTAIYGIMDKNATSETTCNNPIPSGWYFLFVPAFALCLIIINQAKWKQAPVMIVIAEVGYIVNFFSAQRFTGNTQIANTLGALAIGVMANLYSRVGSTVENWTLDLWDTKLRKYWKRFREQVFNIESRRKSAKKLEEGVAGDDESSRTPQARRVGYSLAAAAMLPAIFVQVPSGLAVSGSLVSGLASANQIAGNATNGTSVVNTTSLSTATDGLNSLAFNVSYSVVQVAIGITVGLFLSAIVVYPLGKRRSGLFSL